MARPPNRAAVGEEQYESADRSVEQTHVLNRLVTIDTVLLKLKNYYLLLSPFWRGALRLLFLLIAGYCLASTFSPLTQLWSGLRLVLPAPWSDSIEGSVEALGQWFWPLLISACLSRFRWAYYIPSVFIGLHVVAAFIATLAWLISWDFQAATPKEVANSLTHIVILTLFLTAGVWLRKAVVRKLQEQGVIKPAEGALA